MKLLCYQSIIINSLCTGLLLFSKCFMMTLLIKIHQSILRKFFQSTVISVALFTDINVYISVMWDKKSNKIFVKHKKKLSNFYQILLSKLSKVIFNNKTKRQEFIKTWKWIHQRKNKDVFSLSLQLNSSVWIIASCYSKPIIIQNLRNVSNLRDSPRFLFFVQVTRETKGNGIRC